MNLLKMNCYKRIYVMKTKCKQVKCGYQFGGCRACEICKCEPNMVDENCDRCYNCENDEGILRWSDKKENEDEIKQKEEMKPIEVKN